MEKLANLEELHQMGFITEKDYQTRLQDLINEYPELKGKVSDIAQEDASDNETNVNVEEYCAQSETTDDKANFTSNLILSSYREMNWDESVSEEDYLDYLRSMDELPIPALFNSKKNLVKAPPLEFKDYRIKYEQPERAGIPNQNYISFPKAPANSSIEYQSDKPEKLESNSNEIIIIPDTEIFLKISNSSKYKKVSCNFITQEKTKEDKIKVDKILSRSDIKDNEELCLNNYMHLHDFPNQLFSHPWNQLYHLEIRNCSISCIPSNLSQLYNLVSVDFSFNLISKVSFEFSGCSNLEYIDLAHNQIYELNNEVYSLPKIKKVNLCGNLLLSNSRVHSFSSNSSNGDFEIKNRKYFIVDESYYPSVPSASSGGYFPFHTSNRKQTVSICPRVTRIQNELRESLENKSGYFEGKETCKVPGIQFEVNPKPFSYL